MISIGSINVENSNVKSFEARKPQKDQKRSRSIDGLIIETVTLGYIHKYILKLQSLEKEKFVELYAKLITLDTTADGKITLETKGEIMAGIVHLPLPEVPSTVEFDFSMTDISIVQKVYYNLTIPLSIYVAV